MSTPADSKQLIFIDPESVQNNIRVNDTIFQFLAIVSGVVCGVLGYTDLKGVAAFLAFNCVIGAAVALKCKFAVNTYFISWDKILVDGASSGLGTFILCWTLFYNICHLF
mmetsp:Transcript_17387/g.43011  ORF Transcript_17387/g.43011 Transcript_17387/m.43011 type:complete len:110 (-) Transcript_17387:33-362(-)|eukprot:CAMPEP_0181385296 /NCGR_PEP_ID=MMETSP1106-20121128/22477_1 /TAXON_ID=81844 /ORGANISM="Mantoniella antarctica, Strain SL-175" /LENGTH=109 /DNA_ID=CAMNT_0023505333 /DNA_START=35 /DNA_END=364 /DNA_ORIENTATION=-